MSNQPQRPNNSNQPPRKTPKFSLSWVYAIIFMVLMFLLMKNLSEEGATRKISTLLFLNALGDSLNQFFGFVHAFSIHILY